MQERNDRFWLNVIFYFILVACLLSLTRFAFANGQDDIVTIQTELITNLEKQVEKQKEINADNEKIIEGNKKIIEMQEKHIELQHKDINRLIDEKAKGGDGIVGEVKKQAAIPMFIWILLSLL